MTDKRPSASDLKLGIDAARHGHFERLVAFVVAANLLAALVFVFALSMLGTWATIALPFGLVLGGAFAYRAFRRRPAKVALAAVPYRRPPRRTALPPTRLEAARLLLAGPSKPTKRT